MLRAEITIIHLVGCAKLTVLIPCVLRLVLRRASASLPTKSRDFRVPTSVQTVRLRTVVVLVLFLTARASSIVAHGVSLF